VDDVRLVFQKEVPILRVVLDDLHVVAGKRRMAVMLLQNVIVMKCVTGPSCRSRMWTLTLRGTAR
jgi:hypothetical protein